MNDLMLINADTVVCAESHSDESIVASMIHFSKIRPAAFRTFTIAPRIASIPKTNPSLPRWGASSSVNHVCKRRFAAQAIQKIREQTVKSAKGMQIKTNMPIADTLAVKEVSYNSTTAGIAITQNIPSKAISSRNVSNRVLSS